MATYEMFVEFFREADTHNHGYLSLDDVVAKLRQCGYRGSERQIKRMFSETDTSGDGLISFDEYMLAMGFTLTLAHKGESLRRIFYEIDEQNTGKIYYTKIEEVLEELKRHFFRADIKRIRENALLMKDSEGYIDYEEFLKKLMLMKIIIIEDFKQTGGRYSIEKRKTESNITTVVTETTTTRRTFNEEEIEETQTKALNGNAQDAVEETITVQKANVVEARVSEPCVTKTTTISMTSEQNNNKNAGASSVGEASTVPKDVRMGVTAVNVKRSKQSNKEQEDQTSTVNVESSDTIDIQDSSTVTASTLETKEIKLPSEPCVATTEIKQIKNIKEDISESDKALMIEVMEDLLGNDDEEDTDTVKMTAVDDGLQPKLPSEPCMTSVTVTTEDTTTVGTSVDGPELATTKDEKGPDLSDSDKKLMTEVLSELIDDTSDDGTTAQQDDIKVTTEVTITTTEQITTNVEVASGIGLTETQTFTQDETAPIETAQEAVETPPEILSDQEKDEEQEVSARISKMGSINFDDGDITQSTVVVETTKTTITTKELINDTVDVKIDNIEPEEKEITADVQQELLSQQNVVEVKMIEVQQEISEIKEAKAGDIKDGTVDVETTKTTITTKELINDTVDAKIDNIEPEEKEITADVQQELLSQQNVVEVKMMEVQQEISEIKEAKAGDIKDVNNTDQEKSETEIISSTTAVTRLSEEDKDLMKKVMRDLIGEDDEETQTIKGIKKENVTKETITITTSEVTQTNDDDNELMKEVMDDLINKTDASEEKAQIDEQTKVERQEDSTLTKTTTTTVITTEVTETTSDQTEQLNIAPEVEITPTTATDLSGTVITTTTTTLHSKDRIEAEQSEKNMNKEDEALMKEVMEDLLDDEDQVKESTPELQQQMSMDEIIKYEVTDVASAPKASEVNDVQEISSVSTVTTTTITTTKTLIDDTGFQQQESVEDDVVIEYDVSETQNVVIEQLTSEASPTVESVPYVQQESTEEDTVIKYDVEISKAEGASSESIESSIESSETYISSEGIGEKVYVESPDNSISSDGVEEKVTTTTTFTTTTSTTTVNTTGGKVQYAMHYWPEDENRTLAILGDIPELGAWDASKAVLAEEYKNTGWWTVNLSEKVPAGKNFAWKWVVVDKNRPRVLRWEIESGGKNRVGKLGTEGAELWFPWKDWSNTV